MNIGFTFAPAGNRTHVYAHINSSMQNAFGATQQLNLDRGKAAHEIQGLLEQVKVIAESGKDR